MSERGRGAIFNTIQQELPGATVLDAFAGTGALGIEALSRGARHVTFIESHRIAQKVIQNNLTTLGIGPERATLARTRVRSWLGTNQDARFDLIFVDPPYYQILQHFSTVERLFSLLKPGALMVLSKPGTCEEEVIINQDIVVVDNRRYGNLTLALYRKKS